MAIVRATVIFSFFFSLPVISPASSPFLRFCAIIEGAREFRDAFKFAETLKYRNLVDQSFGRQVVVRG